MSLPFFWSVLPVPANKNLLLTMVTPKFVFLLVDTLRFAALSSDEASSHPHSYLHTIIFVSYLEMNEPLVKR